ncbi:MAG TPA: flagellar biosynthetic protein FliO [Candidatus Tyrphobacter sp.]
MLSPQASLHVVCVGSRRMLLGAGREGVTALGDLPGEASAVRASRSGAPSP